MSEPLGEKLSIALTDPLTLTRDYYCRMSFHESDLVLITRRCGEYVSKWNSRNAARFKMEYAGVESMTDGNFIVIRGRSKNAESFQALKCDIFWGQHEHIKNIHQVDAWYLGSTVPEVPPPPGTPDEPGAPGAGTGKIPIWLIVVGIGVLVIVGFFLFRKKR